MILTTLTFTTASPILKKLWPGADRDEKGKFLGLFPYYGPYEDDFEKIVRLVRTFHGPVRSCAEPAMRNAYFSTITKKSYLWLFFESGGTIREDLVSNRVAARISADALLLKLEFPTNVLKPVIA